VGKFLFLAGGLGFSAHPASVGPVGGTCMSNPVPCSC